jgi:hypothetical protein
MVAVYSPSLRRQAIQLVRPNVETKLRPGPSNERLRCDAAVVDDSVMNAEPASPQRRAARQAGRVGHIAVFVANPVGRDAVDVRARVAMVTVAGQVIGSQGVDVDVQDSHGAGCDGTVGPRPTLYKRGDSPIISPRILRRNTHGERHHWPRLRARR